MKAFLVTFLVLISLTSVEARKLPTCDYPDMEKASDFVGIVEVTNVSLSTEKLPDVKIAEWYQGYLATVRPLWTKKGEIKNENLKILFFRFNEKKKSDFSFGEPTFVALKEGRQYLVFLKASPSYYTAVTGDYDPGYSIRLVTGAVDK